MWSRMSSGFHPSRRGIEARLSRDERAVLRGLVGEVLELVEMDAPAVPEDPLAAMVGISDLDLQLSDDPVLARLFPDAYADDAAASGDFRRYTESDLRAGKRDAARAMLASLPPGSGRVVLDRPTAEVWLAALNDVRLALGTRLGVCDEDQPGT